MRFCGLLCYFVRCLHTGISVRFSCGFLMLFCKVFIPVFLCGFAMLFCTVFGAYIPVFLCGFAVFVPSSRPSLFRLLSDLNFYYMYVKVSCKGIDTEADLSVLIHATLISRSSNPLRIRRLPNICHLHPPPPSSHPRGVLVGLMAGSPE